MTRKISLLKTQTRSPFEYAYDKSGYVVLEGLVRRDANTGQLIAKASRVLKDPPKNKKK